MCHFDHHVHVHVMGDDATSDVMGESHNSFVGFTHVWRAGRRKMNNTDTNRRDVGPSGGGANVGWAPGWRSATFIVGCHDQVRYV